jgi:LytR cell envelope-related transcriptional attenuator
VQYAESAPSSFPWRTTTLVVGAVAALELVALIAIGAVHLAPQAKAAAIAKAKPKPLVHVVVPVPHVASRPLRARNHVRVLVLNANGVQGAAGSTATRLEVYGYRIAGAQNAQRHDYAQSMVMFVPGWVKEARRLAKETGIKLVAPVDGLRAPALKGSTLVVILGS